MAETTKKTRLAVVLESTEGTPVAPSSGNDYVPIREGFSVETAVETVDSDEIRASIGKSKSFTTSEAGSASIPIYLHHSGTEAQTPKAGVSALYQMAYGELNAAGAQVVTAGGSTTTVLKVADTSTFSVGEAVLVKHTSNPWEIRVIKSIPNGTDLHMLFALSVAPGAGVGLGRAVHYDTADSPSTSTIWDYRGNGGAIQVISGSRVSGLTIGAAANELLGSEFSLEATGIYFDSLYVVAGTNDKLDFNETGPTLRAATITAGLYKTPHHLAAEIERAMDAVATDDITVTYSDTTGKYTIATAGALLELLWNTGVNTADTIGGLIGFNTAADDTGALTYTGDNPIDIDAPHTPSFDDSDALVAKNMEMLIGSQDDNVCFCVEEFSYELTNNIKLIDCMCAETGLSGSIIESREVTASLTGVLEAYKADLFKAMIDNESISWEFNFGTKVAGNWVAGKSGSLHLKDCTVTTHTLDDSDGLVTMNIEISAHVDSNASSETGLNFL